MSKENVVNGGARFDGARNKEDEEDEEELKRQRQERREKAWQLEDEKRKREVKRAQSGEYKDRNSCSLNIIRRFGHGKRSEIQFWLDPLSAISFS